MRRGRLGPLALALTLTVLGASACSDQGDAASDRDASTTTEAGSTTAGDLSSQVDAFCAKAEEVTGLLAGLGNDPNDPPTAMEEAQIEESLTDATQMMIPLQLTTSAMTPGDAARFQECADLLGGTGGIQGP
jgi:hypothetical protein